MKCKNVINLRRYWLWHIIVIAFSIFPLLFLNTGCEQLENQNANNTEAIDEASQEFDSLETVAEDKEDTEESLKENEDNTEPVQDDGKDEEAGSDQEEQLQESESSIQIRVYFSDELGEYLVGESRNVSSEYRYIEAITELIKLPINDKLKNLVSKTTKINSVEVEDGMAIVDLSLDFINDRFDSDIVDILLVYSIVNTLTEFSEIDNVSFKIDGEDLETIGMLDLSDPLYRKNDLIVK